ncbi:MAG: chalcone isomerase family protein [Xanthomonadales bacterium]|nr:chalcone isomerase family protein [Xanthomonadales bacterium]
MNGQPLLASLTTLIAVAVGSAVSPPLSAADLVATVVQEEPTPSDASFVNSDTLQECSRVKMRVFGGLITIGEASLHLSDCADAQRVLDPVPKQFSIDLSRDASAQRLQAMADDLIEENFSPRDKQRFHCITQSYIDAEAGSRYDVRYIPKLGLQLWLDQQLLAHCPEDAKPEDYFAIWFGHKPFNKKLKQRLVQQALDE